MADLDLTQRRGWHTIELRETKTGKIKTFKIPQELNVAETEYILEIQEGIDKLQDERKSDDGSAQLRLFWDKIFAMAVVLFKHYQPDITEKYLRDNLSTGDILQLTGFFENKRYLIIKKEEERKKALAV